MYDSCPLPRLANPPDCDSTSIARACREAAAIRHTDRTPTENDDRVEGRTRPQEDGRSDGHRHESSWRSDERDEDRRSRRHGRHRDRRHSRHRSRDRRRHSSREDESQAPSPAHRNDRYADRSPDLPHQLPASSEDTDAREADDLRADGVDDAESSDVAAVGTSHSTPGGEEDEFEDSDGPVMQSLESRIEAILSQSTDCAVPFLSPGSASPSQQAVPPPLPVDDGFPGPPLPCPPDASHLPVSTQSVFPPSEFWPGPPAENPEMFAYRDVADSVATVDSVAAVNGYSGAGEDDDRMSMSSLSSGEEKLEVNVPASAGLGDGQWPPPAMGLIANAAYLVDKLNQLNDLKSTMEPSPDNLVKFDTVLEQVIKDLRLVMYRDVRKKMVENTGFKSFEKWCDDKVQHRKVMLSSFITDYGYLVEIV